MSVFSDPLVEQTDVMFFTTLSRHTIYRHVKQGIFPRPIKQGSKLLWRESQIEKWLSERETETQAA